MKTFTKIVCLCLVLALFAAMALGSSSDDGEKKDILTDGIGTQSGDQSGDNKTPTTSAPKVDVTIEEQVLLAWNDLTITATGYVTDSFWGDGIKVLIENKGDKDLGISCNALIVNNYMISDLFSATVAAGKKSNETIYLSSSDLEASGITNVGQIELYFHIYDSDDYDTLHDSEGITLKTSAFDQMDTTPNDLGAELYNKDGIRIVGKYVDEDSFWGAAVLLYIENTTGKNINVSCDDISINGFMVDSFFYSTVYAGKMAMDTITISASDLEENDITSIDEIELKFRIVDSETYKEIDETDPIAFTVK